MASFSHTLCNANMSFQVVFGFSQFDSMSEVDRAVTKVKLIGGKCNAGAALSHCKTSLFVGPAQVIARILVVLMAGKSSDVVSTAALSLKTVGVKILAVGMGGSFDQSQLSNMAFTSSYVQKAATFGDLKSMSGNLVTLISQGMCKMLCI